ncbi:MAG: Gldg family protein [Verrucomicrobiota bacterium]
MDTEKKSTFHPALASSAWIVAVVLIAIFLNSILGNTSLGRGKVDLTQDKLHTLAPGTRAILEGIDTPVTLRFYYTRDSQALPRPYKLHAQKVEDLLARFSEVAGPELLVEIYDTQPDTDAEDSAKLDLIPPRRVGLEEVVYFGIAVSCLGEKERIPVLDPDNEELLEYEVIRAISRVMNPEPKRIAVLSSLSVLDFGSQRGNWAFRRSLGIFEAEELDAMDLSGLDDRFDLLLLYHPPQLDEAARYAIDQYLLRGGKILAFLDPYSYAASEVNQANQRQMNPMMGQAPQLPLASDLPEFLESWGQTFHGPSQFGDALVLADLRYRTRVSLDTFDEFMLTFSSEAMNEDDITTSGLRSLSGFAMGGFSGQAPEGLEKSVLVQTSDKTALMPSSAALQTRGPEAPRIEPSGVEYEVAIRLKGNFSTLFPEGPPGEEEASEEEETASEEGPEHLAEASAPGAVVLVADTDFLLDQLAYDNQRPEIVFINGQPTAIPSPRGGNEQFFLNLLDEMTGDTNLVGARGRSLRRPFTLLNELEAEAERRIEDKIETLQEGLSQAQARFEELQEQRRGGAGNAVDREALELEEKAQAGIVRFQKDIRELEKETKSERDTLLANITLVNVLVPPLVVALAGITVAILRRFRNSAR